MRDRTTAMSADGSGQRGGTKDPVGRRLRDLQRGRDCALVVRDPRLYLAALAEAFDANDKDLGERPCHALTELVRRGEHKAVVNHRVAVGEVV